MGPGILYNDAVLNSKAAADVSSAIPRVGGLTRGRPIVFVVNHAAFFVSHRLSIAKALIAQGVPVRLLTGQGSSPSMEAAAVQELAAAGVWHTRVRFRSASVNPLAELVGVLHLLYFLVRWRPALVHCVSPKGILYGGLAARLARVPAIVLAVSGMGYGFTPGAQRSFLRSFVGMTYKTLARFAYRHSRKRVITQNDDDLTYVIDCRLAKPGETVLIQGSGVDLDELVGAPLEAKQPIVLLPARMLKDKGVAEFVQAAAVLKRNYPAWRFVLAGAADYENPSSISASQLDQWQREGHVEWLGYVSDMSIWYRHASIVCLPSYREGMPKALLEAAAAGCAVVTTDVTGCRDAVVAGHTGLLVPARDAVALAEALLTLFKDRECRESLGRHGRERAIQQFGIDAVIAATMHLYRELLEESDNFFK
jgi:glycosyltransferase involved in cell wall biosynthesis